jgi:hypothetical protein
MERMSARVPITDWRKQELLQWLCTLPNDRDPSTAKEMAERLGISAQTMRNWKDDAEFLEAWQYLYRRTIGSPERMQLVLERLFETATDRTDPRQVPAAREYRIAVEGVAPTKVEMTVRSAKDLSDEDLEAMMAAAARSELERRE